MTNSTQREAVVALMACAQEVSALYLQNLQTLRGTGAPTFGQKKRQLTKFDRAALTAAMTYTDDKDGEQFIGLARMTQDMKLDHRETDALLALANDTGAFDALAANFPGLSRDDPRRKMIEGHGELAVLRALYLEHVLRALLMHMDEKTILDIVKGDMKIVPRVNEIQRLANDAFGAAYRKIAPQLLDRTLQSEFLNNHGIPFLPIVTGQRRLDAQPINGVLLSHEHRGQYMKYLASQQAQAQALAARR